MKNLFLILWSVIGLVKVSKAQSDCYLNKARFAQWKESLSKSLVRTYENDTSRFNYLINYLDYSIFDSLCNKLSVKDRIQSCTYYILINHSSGEYSTTEIILRVYNKVKGYEVRYSILPLEEKKLFITNYKHKPVLFNSIFKKLNPPIIASSSMIAISVFSNKNIQTKWYSVDINNYKRFEKLIGTISNCDSVSNRW